MSKRTIVVTSYSSEVFDQKVNTLTRQGWRIIPESLRAEVSTTSNAWKAEAQTETVFGVVLEEIE